MSLLRRDSGPILALSHGKEKAMTISGAQQRDDDKTRILFVDDEPNVLSGLRRMLHSYRCDWGMSFVPGGREALETIERERFDVIVSDMRMPGVDGGTLLREAKRLSPSTLRVVLSGQADRDAIIDCIEHTHQYLAKPCAPEDLKRRILQARSAWIPLRHNSLLNEIASVSALPLSSENFLEFTRELNENTPSLATLGSLARRDPAFAAKVLQLVNSSFFTTGAIIYDPAEAVQILGADTLGRLQATGKTFTTLVDRLSPVSLKAINAISVENAKVFARRRVGSDPTEVHSAYAAGLMADIGLHILAVAVPDVVECYLEHIAAHPDEKELAQVDVFGATIREFSVYILALWGTPDPILEEIRNSREGLSTAQVAANGEGV